MKSAVVLLAILSSCQSDVVRTTHAFLPTPLHWSFSCDFPKKHKRVVREGFAYWEKILGKPMFVEDRCGVADFFIPGKRRGIAVVISDVPEYKVVKGKRWTLWAAAPMATFSNDILSGLIVFFPMWQTETNSGLRRSVVRHEIGHILGFDHSSSRKCLMYEVIDSNEFDKGLCLAEIKRLHEVYR